MKVTDFGIARAGTSQMTEDGSIVGTAQYLSPEQARGTNVDQRSDLYSLGVVLYELLTGSTPFSGDTPVEIAMKHLSQVPDPPSAKRPTCRTTSICSSCARSRRIRTTATRARRRWTPTSSASRAASPSRARRRSRRRRFSPRADTGAMRDRRDDDRAAVASRRRRAACGTAGARLLRPRRAAAPTSALAVGRRARCSSSARSRRLVPVRPDLEQDLVERAGRRRVLHQPHAVGGRGQDPRDRADAGGEDRAEPDDARPASSTSRTRPRARRSRRATRSRSESRPASRRSRCRRSSGSRRPTRLRR